MLLCLTNRKTAETKFSPSSSFQSSPSSAPVPSNPGSSSAVIGKTVVIKGEVTGDENLIIEGKVEGSINLHAHELAVGKSGEVNADITAKVVRIEGQVEGDIIGNDVVTITRSGNVRGNIVSPRVTLEDGAKFKGSIDMDPGESANRDARVSAKVPQISVEKPADEKAANHPAKTLVVEH